MTLTLAGIEIVVPVNQLPRIYNQLKDLSSIKMIV